MDYCKSARNSAANWTVIWEQLLRVQQTHILHTRLGGGAWTWTYTCISPQLLRPLSLTLQQINRDVKFNETISSPVVLRHTWNHGECTMSDKHEEKVTWKTMQEMKLLILSSHKNLNKVNTIQNYVNYVYIITISQCSCSAYLYPCPAFTLVLLQLSSSSFSLPRGQLSTYQSGVIFSRAGEGRWGRGQAGEKGRGTQPHSFKLNTWNGWKFHKHYEYHLVCED